MPPTPQTITKETSSNIMLPNSSPLWLGTKLMDTVCRVLKGFASELHALGNLRKQRQTLPSCVEEPLADKKGGPSLSHPPPSEKASWWHLTDNP
jgi:hypothetical protein